MSSPSTYPPRSVLIVCTHFPPLNRTGARRPYYLAKELRARGHKVQVITSDESEDATWYVDLEGMTVKRYPRGHLQHDMSAVQRAIARFHHSKRNSALHGPIRVIADLLLPIDHSDRWDLDAEQVAQELEVPDIVLATGPAWSAAQTACRLARSWNATFVLDYRDPWCIADPSVHMDIVSGYGKGLAGLMRRAVFRRHEKLIGSAAYALTAVSEPFLKNAQRITGNLRGAAFQGGFVPYERTARTKRNAKFTITYTGRVYTEQNWDVVLDTLVQLSAKFTDLEDHFTLRLIGAVSNDTALMERLRATANRTSALELVPRMTREQTLEEQHRADAVLHLTYRDRSGFLPVKFLEYLNAGRPILLVTKEHDLMEEIVISTRTGMLIPDSVSLTSALAKELENWRAGRPWVIQPDQKVLRTYEYGIRMEPWAEQLLAWDHERRAAQGPWI